MQKKYILVLGSKPGSKLPNIKDEKIFTANGAAERAVRYLDRFPNTLFTAVVGNKEFTKNNVVQSKVIKSNPDILLSRLGNINFEKYDFKKKTKFDYLTYQESLNLQSQFFNFGIFSIIFSELNYGTSFTNKIFHLLKSIKNKTSIGVSTGFFSIIYALKLYPEHDILISGIGMSSGGHYYDYDKNSKKYDNRSKVDRALMNNLKKKFKNKLYTLDNDLKNNSNIPLLETETF